MRIVDDLWRDLRYAARTLRKTPGFAAVAVLTLALGIGANTAVFSVVNAVIFRPLPVRDADRLAVIATTRRSTSTLHGVSLPDLQDYRSATRDVFEDIAGYNVGFIGLASESGRPARVLVSWVTQNYFQLLGIRPALGRLMRAEEGESDRTDSIVVLGYSTWQRRFGGDPSVVGRKAILNGQPCTIIGVVPPEFVGTFAFSESEVYLPLNWTAGATLAERDARGLHAVARLRAGTTIERAQAALTVVGARLEAAYPDTNRGVALRVLPERLARPEEDNARSNAFGATIILALVGLVLLVAEVNVTNLLLARASTRRKELAIRVALGASRGRLIQQLLTESAMIAALGGVAGVCVGMWTGRLLTMIRLPGDLPVRLDFHLDGHVLGYAVALTAATALLVGLIAARRAARPNVDQALHGRGDRSSSAAGGYRTRSALVVVQIAVCFMLLVAAGVFTRSLTKAENIDLGFKPEGVLNIQMDVAQAGYTESRGRAFFAEVERRVRRLAGVEHVGFAFSVPMGYVSASSRLDVEGRSITAGDRPVAGKNIVDPGYFATMGIPIERGRSFTEADDRRARPVAIVNQRLVDTIWPGQDPIGRRFSDAGAEGPWMEVIGVTGTGKYRLVFEDPQPYFYASLAQQYTPLRALHVRTALSPTALAPAVEQAIHDLEPNLPLYDVQSMTRALEGGRGFFLMRTGALFAAILAFLGLTLAVVGLYGVVSYMTNERTHEIGVRIALGANRSSIVAMVLQEGARLTARGMAAGLVGAVVLTRLLERLLFGVAPTDPVAFALASICLPVVTLAATYLPARRAMRVEPMVALRSE
jgi:putative ABC transport system permease protein